MTERVGEAPAADSPWRQWWRPALLAMVCLILGPCVTLSPEAMETARQERVRAESEEWANGRGMGISLLLQKNGRYESDRYCDICMPRPTQGHWVREAARIILTPDSGAPPRTLVPIVFKGCPGMKFEDDPPPRFPGDVFFERGESCSGPL